MVLVSHDMRLIQQVAKDIYECEHGKITRFKGDILQYKQVLQAKLDRAAAAFDQESKKRAAAGGAGIP